MLGWLKDKLIPGQQESSGAATALRAHFEPLEKVPGTKPHIAQRLTRFVLTGGGEGAVAELAALKGTSNAFLISAVNFAGTTLQPKQSLASLLRLLPEDPELYLRLARVYDAAQETPGGAVLQLFFLIPIPAFQGPLSWLSTFLVQLSRAGKERAAIFPVNLLLAMIASSGEDPSVLVKGAFFYDDAKGKSQVSRWTSTPFAYFQCLEGYAELVLNSTDIVRPAFRQKDASSRACVLRALETLNISPEPFVPEIASLAVGGSKEVREAAIVLISPRFPIFKSLLESHAQKGSSDERYHAVRLLSRIGGDAERAFLSARLDDEKSARVAGAIKEGLADQSSGQTAAGVEDYDLPEVPEVASRAPLDKQVLTDLRLRLREVERKTAEEFARNQFAKRAGWTRTQVPPEAADRLFEALQNLVVKDDTRFPFFRESRGVDNQLLFNCPIPPQFQLIHVIRWCLLLSTGPTSKVEIDRWALSHRWQRALLSYQKLNKKKMDLRELAAVLRAIGFDDRVLGRQLLQSNRYAASPFLRSDNLLWPYFAERLDLLEEALGLKQDEEESPYRFLETDKRQNAFGILKLFPRLPARFVPMLWDIALGSGKTERPWAQECLEKIPNKEEKVVAALASRQQDARMAAAQWLSRLGYKDAIPELRQALSKEKSEVVKDELIKTLEAFGVRLEELLDRDKLDEEAERGLKKGIPKELDWFPFDQLPAVSWSDSGKPVPSQILHWFIVQGHKLKNAEANPTLRRYCSLLRKNQREKLGRFVMESWIAKDTKPKYTAEQAAAIAQQQARQMAAYAKQHPQYHPDFDEQRSYQAIFNSYLTHPEGSQIGTKGILAVAGACCGGDAAPIVHRYIKQWYGYRGAQSKALLQVLAWIDHPSATQVILSVANRFRTKGIQEEAMRLCQMLAERKGWTLDELADRTIPTAGFDENGKMELDYGPRKFSASLSEEMNIAITNPSGKTIASLPDANKSDDAEKARAAKTNLSTSRKELKSVLAMQRDRLYESLCTQRTWRFEDWDTYLRRHPIVGRYCQRLIWVAYEGAKIVESFRPLADGTLTNHRDDEVTLAPEAAVRLGHDETLPLEDRTAWLQHFADYKVEPLFQQFGKATFGLPEDMKEANEIKDFLGHLVKAFSLRNRLTRLGYTRGAAQDAGWFFEYRKTFLRLGIEAIIEFTGNGLPEENRTVALQRLYFARKIDTGGGSITEELTLGELPGVLLSECWNDIRMAAAEGPGFAPDWEKQTEI